jgi:O-antigen ligase
LKLDISGTYEGGRFFVWNNSLKIIAEHPLFGVGQGNFHEQYVSLLPSDIPDKRKLTHAHNDWLNITAISGIPGGLIFLVLWLVVLRKILSARNVPPSGDQENDLSLPALLGCIVFISTALFEATFADEEVRQVLMFIWAAGLFPLYNKQRAAGIA